MSQAHAFKAAELCLIAQERAEVVADHGGRVTDRFTRKRR
jgi:hypothetical protein